MSDFHSIYSQSLLLNDKRACGPIAVALITGQSFKQAQRQLKKLGRQVGQGTPRWMTHQAIRDKGLTLRRLKRMELKCRTIRTLERAVSKRSNLLVHTNHHVLAIVDGKVQDWTRGRRHRIQEIYLVEKA